MNLERSPSRPRLALLLAAVLTLAACGGSGDGNDTAGDDPIGDGVTATEPGDRAVQVVSADKVRLFGTLTVPPAATSSAVPGVLLVPSAGPGDRNGLIAATGVADSIGRDLADAFTGSGLVTYRYDRRGTAESRLDQDQRVTLDALVNDARAGLDLLAQRKEATGRDLAVVGYGDGGLIALRLAAVDDRVKRLVLVSTPGRSLVDVQAAELAAQYGPESAEALRSTVAGLLATRTLPPLDAMRAELRPLLPPENAAFLADLYALDPAAEGTKVKAATLIVVPSNSAPYDAARLSGAIRGAQVVTAQAGPTLEVVGETPLDDKSDPASPTHEHGAAPPVAPVKRDAASLDRISGFLTAASPRP